MGLLPFSNSYLISATQSERSAIQASNHSKGILGSRLFSYPERKELLVDYKARLEAGTQECFAKRPGRLRGLVYLFKAKTGLDRIRFPHNSEVIEQLEALKQKFYPALEGNMQSESYLPPNQGAPILPALEYRLIEGENGTYSTYPDPQALLASWHEIRTNPQHKLYKPGLPEIKVCWGDGIASDRDFVYSYLEYDALLSSGKEFIHDQDFHIKCILYFAWTNPELYKNYRSWHVDIFRKIAKHLDAKAERGEDEAYLKEMWLILGFYVDIQSSKYGSNSKRSWPATQSFNFSSIQADFWKKRTGEFPDVYRLNKLWRKLISECLTPEESGIYSSVANEPTAITFAAQDGRADYLLFLLERLKKMDPSMLREAVSKPASANVPHPLFIAAQRDHLECLNLLIEHGADIDQQSTSKGATALIVASECGQDASVERLIACGAQLNLSTNGGVTAVYQAAWFGRPGCLKLLLESGAEFDCIASDKTTALFMAAQKGNTECVKLLLEHGAAPNRYCLDVEVTPFYVAVQNGHKDCVELFLRNGGNPENIRSDESFTALELAKDYGHMDCVEILEKAQAAS